MEVSKERKVITVIKVRDYYTVENFTCVPGGVHDYTKTVERRDYRGLATYRISCVCGSSVRALQYARYAKKGK
jgi:hypothetical protein